MNADKIFATALVGAFMLACTWPVETLKLKAAPAPEPPAEIAAGIDYSQEVGLPVEWEDYTITGEEAAKRIRQQTKGKEK